MNCQYCKNELPNLYKGNRSYCQQTECIDEYIRFHQKNMIDEIQTYVDILTDKYKDIFYDTNILPMVYIDYCFINRLKFSSNDSDDD